MEDKTSPKPQNDGMIGSTSAQNVETSDQSSDRTEDADFQNVAYVADDQEDVDMPPQENTEGASSKGIYPLADLMVSLTDMIKDLANDLKRSTTEVQTPMPVSTNRTEDQVVVALAAVPITTWRGPDEAAAVIDTPEAALEPLKKKKTPSHLLGDINASFEVINGLHADNINLNEFILAAFGEDYAKEVKELQKFSFTQRLTGWKLECRARVSGKCDLYYYHGEANKTFRSVKEVVNFMLFEAYPGGKTAKEFFQLGDAGASTSSDGSARRKKPKRNVPLNQEAEQSEAEAVRLFYEEANENLLNFFNK